MVKMRSANIFRRFSSITNPVVTAWDVYQKSCYKKVDFKIKETLSLKDAVQRFTSFDVGCLAVTNEEDKVVGIFTKRDYVNKVVSLGKEADHLFVKDVATYSPNIIYANKTESIDSCMNKMIFKDIRHLLVLDKEDTTFVGLLSIKDLMKEVMNDKSGTISRLSDFTIGKGAFFGSE